MLVVFKLLNLRIRPPTYSLQLTQLSGHQNAKRVFYRFFNAVFWSRAASQKVDTQLVADKCLPILGH